MQADTKELISNINSQLKAIYHNEEQAKMLSWAILEFITHQNKSQLILNKKISLSDEQAKELEKVLYMHTIKLKPLQYIFKKVPFLAIDVLLKEPILIPRSETEQWCHEIIQRIKDIKNLTILDLCTGTGCIGLAIAKEKPDSIVYAIDLLPEACKLAEQNAKHNNIENIKIIRSNLYQNLPKDLKFDLIVSNPPYISYKQWKHLDPMVKKWESRTALIAKDSGTYLIKKIIKQAVHWLKPNNQFIKTDIPQLIIEIDQNQSSKVTKLLRHYGFTKITTKKDLFEVDRVIEASFDGK